MKIEEIVAKYKAMENPSFDDLLTELYGADDFSDRDAEIASLKEENKSLIDNAAKQTKELEETKKLNFTLGRQVSRQPIKLAEEILNDMFFNKEKKNT